LQGNGTPPHWVPLPVRIFVFRSAVFFFNREGTLSPVNQLPLPLTAPVPGLAYVRAGTATIPVRFVRNGRARRYLLRLDRDGAARVTVPRGGSLREARAFVDRHRAWLHRQHVERLRRTAIEGSVTPGGVLLDGQRVAAHVARDASGRGLWTVGAGGWQVRVAGAASESEALAAALRARARATLSSRLMELATEHDIRVAGVSIRDQRTRWGSCSAAGRISLNWRLIQMPPAIRDYVLVHELAHVAVPNHSRRFWRTVERIYPDWRDAERWLRKQGRALL
jgi:predicted metal-dependent hydrolase